MLHIFIIDLRLIFSIFVATDIYALSKKNVKKVCIPNIYNKGVCKQIIDVAIVIIIFNAVFVVHNTQLYKQSKNETDRQRKCALFKQPNVRKIIS